MFKIPISKYLCLKCGIILGMCELSIFSHWNRPRHTDDDALRERCFVRIFIYLFIQRSKHEHISKYLEEKRRVRKSGADINNSVCLCKLCFLCVEGADQMKRYDFRGPHVLSITWALSTYVHSGELKASCSEAR